MRSARSSLATSSTAPSSTPLRPSFHASATRMPNCSMVSGWVVGMSSTASCAPFLASEVGDTAQQATDQAKQAADQAQHAGGGLAGQAQDLEQKAGQAVDEAKQALGGLGD